MTGSNSDPNFVADLDANSELPSQIRSNDLDESTRNADLTHFERLLFSKQRNCELIFFASRVVFRSLFVSILIMTIFVMPQNIKIKVAILLFYILLTATWLLEIHHSILSISSIYRIIVDNSSDQSKELAIRTMNATNLRARNRLNFDPWLIEPIIWFVMSALIATSA